MTKTVEFYFDLGSPTTYLAHTQLAKICADTQSELIYIPMLLGGVFKATGNASPAMIPAKGRYMFQDSIASPNATASSSDSIRTFQSTR